MDTGIKFTYAVKTEDGRILPEVTNLAGYAGNGKPIDAVRVYYNTPDDIVSSHGYQKAQYRVSPVNRGYYDWQFDNETGNGQDGYEGCFGKPIDWFQLF